MRGTTTCPYTSIPRSCRNPHRKCQESKSLRFFHCFFGWQGGRHSVLLEHSLRTPSSGKAALAADLIMACSYNNIIAFFLFFGAATLYSNRLGFQHGLERPCRAGALSSSDATRGMRRGLLSWWSYQLHLSGRRRRLYAHGDCRVRSQARGLAASRCSGCSLPTFS